VGAISAQALNQSAEPLALAMRREHRCHRIGSIIGAPVVSATESLQQVRHGDPAGARSEHVHRHHPRGSVKPGDRIDPAALLGGPSPGVAVLLGCLIVRSRRMRRTE
jgi:hypothetical protein